MNLVQQRRKRPLEELLLVVLLVLPVGVVDASTYVVNLPLDSSVYDELETLNGLGYLDTYLDEIKPISRVEAARLTLEAEHNLSDSEHNDSLARALIHTLRAQLHEELSWLESGTEDRQPTMVHPLERLEAQYVFSRGEQRQWRTSPTGVPGDFGINAEEATPLLPNNDGQPTAAGSNEIARWSGWAGVGGFLTGYGEGAVAGPLTRDIHGISRLQPLGTAAVLSLGNVALSFGTEEMWWGTGHFAALSQSDNASPFPALRLQNIHPIILPWIFRYLGQFRYQIFFGQLDGERYFAHPWIDGEIFSFKPVPMFEVGFTHAIDFGGLRNDNYSALGFLGRATGFATGNPVGANTNSRGGVYLKFYFPSLRNLEVYQEILGEDNLTYEISGVGRFMPFLNVSYQGGFYLPRLTADGLTDLRFEYAITSPGYSIRVGDSLYWTYENQLMGDPLGPNASEVDLQAGRWLDLRTKVSADVFYTEQVTALYEGNAHIFFPANSAFYPYSLTKEHSFGVGLDLLSLPAQASKVSSRLAELPGLLGGHAKLAVEYTSGLNYQPHAHSVRAMVLLSTAMDDLLPGWGWR